MPFAATENEISPCCWVTYESKDSLSLNFIIKSCILNNPLHNIIACNHNGKYKFEASTKKLDEANTLIKIQL